MYVLRMQAVSPVGLVSSLSVLWHWGSSIQQSWAVCGQLGAHHCQPQHLLAFNFILSFFFSVKQLDIVPSEFTD